MTRKRRVALSVENAHQIAARWTDAVAAKRERGRADRAGVKRPGRRKLAARIQIPITPRIAGELAAWFATAKPILLTALHDEAWAEREASQMRALGEVFGKFSRRAGRARDALRNLELDRAEAERLARWTLSARLPLAVRNVGRLCRVGLARRRGNPQWKRLSAAQRESVLLMARSVGIRWYQRQLRVTRLLDEWPRPAPMRGGLSSLGSIKAPR